MSFINKATISDCRKYRYELSRTWNKKSQKIKQKNYKNGQIRWQIG